MSEQILQVASQHGPATFILFLVLGIIVWYLKSIVAPKAKNAMENENRLAAKQLQFIDNIEMLVKMQTDKSAEIANSMKEITSGQQNMIENQRLMLQLLQRGT